MLMLYEQNHNSDIYNTGNSADFFVDLEIRQHRFTLWE